MACNHTDLLQAAQYVLPLFEFLNADNNLVSCSFSDFLLEERVLFETAWVIGERQNN